MATAGGSRPHPGGRRTGLVWGLLVCGLALLAGACGARGPAASSSPVTTRPPTGATTSTPSTGGNGPGGNPTAGGSGTPGGSTTGATSGSASQGSAAHCASAVVRVSLVIQAATGVQPGNRVRGMVVATDVGAPCSLDGFLRLQAASPGTTTLRPVAVEDLDLPDPPAPVELQEGDLAFAGVEWTTGSGPACHTVSALEVSWPGASSPVTATVEDPSWSGTLPAICTGGTLVTPFQGSAYRTVSFPDATGAGLARCTPASLEAAAVGGAGKAGAVELLLTNRSPEACVLDGPVGAAPAAGSLRASDTAGGPGGRPVAGNSGGGTPALAVEPGQTVSQRLSWPFAGGAASSCPVPATHTLELRLPGGVGEVTVRLPHQPCTSGPVLQGAMQVGTAPAG